MYLAGFQFKLAGVEKSQSAANLFRVPGVLQAGQCTLVVDESERISDDPDIMAYPQIRL
jgi:hypothetical protein